MKRLFTLLCFVGIAATAAAQVGVGKGQLSASFETNSIYYMEDKGLEDAGVVTPDDRFGSNNYLKVDYTYGRFSAGLQVEGYLPALQGYDLGVYGPGNKFVLATKYVNWQDDNFSVRVGDIFDQFGNGLIFRSYEDRALGFNNSVEGVGASYNFGSYVRLKGMYGRPRLYTGYADSWVRGLDLSVSLADIFKWSGATLALEGSYVNRFEALDKDENIDFAAAGVTSPNLNMYSGRLNFEYKGITLQGEYVTKGDYDLISNVDAHASKGNAWLGQLGYSKNRLGVLATFRRLENMGTLLTLYGEGTGNVLNYLPGLTRQYTYLLANLNPYQVNVRGEVGGQFDVYYSIRNKSDRARWWNFHVNYSTYYTLKDNGGGENKLLWSDINADVERQWNRKLKTSLLFSRQEWDPNHGGSGLSNYVSNIFVGEMTYKFDKKKSIRAEVQYLFSEDYEGDWVAALVEFSLAPAWSFFASDMYNIDVTKKHYYNAGFSFTKSRTRIQLSYGRNRAGYVCSGGVCRFSPAYTGVNLMLTSSF